MPQQALIVSLDLIRHINVLGPTKNSCGSYIIMGIVYFFQLDFHVQFVINLSVQDNYTNFGIIGILFA